MGISKQVKNTDIILCKFNFEVQLKWFEKGEIYLRGTQVDIYSMGGNNSSQVSRSKDETPVFCTLD